MEDTICDALNSISVGSARVVFGMIVWRVCQTGWVVGETINTREHETLSESAACDILLNASGIW